MRGRAGVSLVLDGCEVRLCDPCARVRPGFPAGVLDLLYRMLYRFGSSQGRGNLLHAVVTFRVSRDRDPSPDTNCS